MGIDVLNKHFEGLEFEFWKRECLDGTSAGRVEFLGEKGAVGLKRSNVNVEGPSRCIKRKLDNARVKGAEVELVTLPKSG